MSTSKLVWAWIWSILGVTLFFVLLWAVGVFGSPWWGAAGVHKDQNSKANRERWSATYNTDWNNLQADKTNIGALWAQAHAKGASEQDQMNLNGQVLNCASDVAAYNSDAQNVLGKQWLPSSMPSMVNASDYCSTADLPVSNN